MFTDSKIADFPEPFTPYIPFILYSSVCIGAVMVFL